MKALKIFFILFGVLPCGLYSQVSDVGIGEWRSHLPYEDAIALAEGGNRIYCASVNGLFYYDKSDNSVGKLTKVNGLSGVAISTIRYNQDLQTLIIAYKNTGVDLLSRSHTVYSIEDIKRKSILGNKSINNIYCRGTMAYLACGFGIVALDVAKKEIKDTYYIGLNGAAAVVNDIHMDNAYFYAAMENGLYRAPLSGNFSDFNNWKKVKTIPNANYSNLCFYNGKMYVSFPGGKTVYALKDTVATTVSALQGLEIRRLENNYETFLATGSQAGYVLSAEDSLVTKFDAYYYLRAPRHLIVDKDKTYWIADFLSGLFNLKTGEKITPNGPFRSGVQSMAVLNNHLWVASGGVDQQYNSIYSTEGIFSFRENKWENLNKFTALPDTLSDVISVAIDPANDNHVFASFYGRGVGEFLDNKLINFYNEKNSSLQKTSHPNFYRVEPTDMAFDGNRNLWVINQRADNTLCMRKPDGTWNSYLLSGSLKDYIVWKLLIDQAGQKWLVLVKGLAGGIPKLGVFNDKGTIDNKSDDSFRFIDLKLNTGEGVVPAAPVCLASDNDGTVWVGTDHGIAVYYTPGEVMDNPAPEQILIQQDGSTQYLLEFETITAIAVDGANRKWVGTARAGVFLFNSDGTRELLHFTEDNSPLLSNEIKTIAVNDHTGEVFFGTPLGIVSYKSTATKGRENLGEAFVYPNPVPPGYTGKIGITGLAENMNVKITDSFGRLVYETRSNGGQAVWDGRTLNGDRIQTGIFLVFCSDDTGEKTVVTKLVFIR